ncbi:hypothetical protein [Lacticaseibacillus sp. GG6-2]
MAFLNQHTTPARVERQLGKRGIPAGDNWVWAHEWRRPVSEAEAQWDIANAYLLAALESRRVLLVATSTTLWVAELALGWLIRVQGFSLRRMTALTLAPDPEDTTQSRLQFVIGGEQHCYAIPQQWPVATQRRNWAYMLTVLAPAGVSVAS